MPRWEHVEDIRRRLKRSLENLGSQDGVRSFWMRHEEEPEASATGEKAPGAPGQQGASDVDRDLRGGETARGGSGSRSQVERLTEGLMAAYEETR